MKTQIRNYRFSLLGLFLTLALAALFCVRLHMGVTKILSFSGLWSIGIIISMFIITGFRIWHDYKEELASIDVKHESGIMLSRFMKFKSKSGNVYYMKLSKDNKRYCDPDNSIKIEFIIHSGMVLITSPRDNFNQQLLEPITKQEFNRNTKWS